MIKLSFRLTREQVMCTYVEAANSHDLSVVQL